MKIQWSIILCLNEIATLCLQLQRYNVPPLKILVSKETVCCDGQWMSESNTRSKN